jgi:hypothetical protein
MAPHAPQGRTWRDHRSSDGAGEAVTEDAHVGDASLDFWNDLTFFVKHRDNIERIAIVGDERWRSLSMMFASVDLRRAPVEFFPAHDISEARAWLVR